MATREAPAPVRIRRAALRLFAAQGFYATGIREIAEAAGIPLLDVAVAEPSLETVFINLTGKELRE